MENSARYTDCSEFFTLVSHLLSDSPALGTQIITEIDSMDGRAGFLIKGSYLPDPVKDLPVQSSIVIQERL